MRIVFSKNKEKRSRSSSSSEANNSFVKNVTSRVSGLLPATITKWFSSPSTSGTNGSAPTVEATDSSTEDEAIESPITTQPPAKRMRYSSPGKFNHYSSTETSCVASNIETIEPYNTVQSPPGRHTFRREPNFVSTPIRPPNDETANESGRDSTMFKTQHNITAISGPSQSSALKRKSIFESVSNKDAAVKSCAKTSSNTVRDLKQPYFKSSLLGSPFYPGRTMYGGASSSYINQPNIKERKVTLVNESSNNSDNTMSQSARRIMDLLEHYSSPLMEAKRIPQYVKRTDDSNTSLNVTSSSPSNKVMSYKTQELHVPSIASILRLKQRSRLMDSTSAARQIIASHSSASEFLPYPSVNPSREQSEKDNKLTTKVKSRLTRAHRSENNEIDTSTVAPLDLPTVVLQIDENNLPKFTFSNQATQNATLSLPKTSFLSKPENNSVAESEAKKVKKSDEFSNVTKATLSKHPFNFSSPVRVSAEPPSAISTPPKFTFGSPERGVDKQKDKEKNDLRTAEAKQNKTSPKPLDGKPEVKQNIGSDPAPPLTSSFFKQNDSNFKGLVTSQASKWECPSCLVRNDNDKNKCVCCEAEKPGTKKETETKMPSLKGIVTTQASKWECPSCLVRNDNDKNKCVCCEVEKPGTKKETDTKMANFKGLVTTQASKWECPQCLVRNDNDKSKCVCCEAEKPGTEKETGKKMFNFGMNKNTTFKFGINHSTQDTEPNKPKDVSTQDSKPKSEESETNNNILDKTPTFTFKLPTKKTDSPTNATKEKVNEVPKVSFKFGMPSKDAAEVPSVSDVSKAPEPAKTVVENKEKPQEVPKIELPKIPEQPKPATELFSSPFQITQEKTPVTSGLSLGSFLSTDKKGVTSTAVVSTSVTTSTDTTPQQKGFSFGGSGLKLSANLFSTPTTTPPTTNIAFASPIQTSDTPLKSSLFQSTEPKTTSSMLMFNKVDTTTTSTVSMFQKPEPTVTTAQQSLPAPTTLFSFGNNAPSTQNQPEKPKFNFTFGSSNKLESSPLFKPSFGTPTDNTNTNKFSTPSGSTIGAGSVLPASTLGGGNGLSAANSLTGTALSSGNGLSAGSNLSGGNGLAANNTLSGGNGLASGNLLSGGNGLSTTSHLPGNGLSAGNALGARNDMTPAASSGGLFGAPSGQKENIWSSSNNTSNNLFASNTTTSTLPKPTTFTFGASTPFNTNNATSTFGSGTAQPAQNVFGISSQTNNNQSSVFSSPVASQGTPNIFGTPQSASNPAPTLGMFGSPSVAPTFGTPNPPIPSFEAPSLAPAPAFNFGAPQSSSIFSFTQQQQQQPPQAGQAAGAPAGGVYSFGGSPCGAPQVQFNMGSAPNTAVRRVRKAVRRNTPR